MGRGRSGGSSLGSLMYQVHQKKVAERDARRAIQDAGSAEERERIEAKQQGREAFADSGRWGHLDQHGRTIPEPAPAAPKPPVGEYDKLKIQPTAKNVYYQSTKAGKKKKATPQTTAPTSAVAGSLGSASGGSVSL